MPKRAKALIDALALQAKLISCTDDLEDVKPDRKALVLSAVSRAWCEVQEKVRVITMRPAPKSVMVPFVPGKKISGQGRARLIRPETDGSDPTQNPSNSA